MHEQKWPDTIFLVRHGESAGNVARREAEDGGLPLIDVASRDMDVPLSDLGTKQAAAVGRWFGDLAEGDRPTAILASPYLRACETARLAAAAGGLDVTVIADERLREKEFGILDRLTHRGVAERFSSEAERRTHLGKFYYRPPGGEAWTDVLLRLRSVIDTLTRDYRGERVLIVTHQVVVLMFRYLLERMTEETVLAIDREHEIANCSVTEYAFDPTLGRHGKMALRRFNFVAPLEDAGAPVTREKDVPIAPR
jgi:broad specificity phosphatase PhoE